MTNKTELFFGQAKYSKIKSTGNRVFSQCTRTIHSNTAYQCNTHFAENFYRVQRYAIMCLHCRRSAVLLILAALHTTGNKEEASIYRLLSLMTLIGRPVPNQKLSANYSRTNIGRRSAAYVSQMNIALGMS